VLKDVQKIEMGAGGVKIFWDKDAKKSSKISKRSPNSGAFF
jgi:hypothetical protein